MRIIIIIAMMIIIDRDSFSMSRMTLLITVFLVLVNIFNTITTNIPKVKTILNYVYWDQSDLYTNLSSKYLRFTNIISISTKTKDQKPFLRYSLNCWGNIYISKIIWNCTQSPKSLLFMKVNKLRASSNAYFTMNWRYLERTYSVVVVSDIERAAHWQT